MNSESFRTLDRMWIIRTDYFTLFRAGEIPIIRCNVSVDTEEIGDGFVLFKRFYCTGIAAENSLNCYDDVIITLFVPEEMNCVGKVTRITYPSNEFEVTAWPMIRK